VYWPDLRWNNALSRCRFREMSTSPSSARSYARDLYCTGIECGGTYNTSTSLPSTSTTSGWRYSVGNTNSGLLITLAKFRFNPSTWDGLIPRTVPSSATPRRMCPPYLLENAATVSNVEFPNFPYPMLLNSTVNPSPEAINSLTFSASIEHHLPPSTSRA
jgi:hypothetical protein